MRGFLIDECLTPWLVAVAHARGHAAAHVFAAGLAGAPDRVIVNRALADELAVVTANAADYLRLLAKVPDHRGLVLLIRPGDRAHQIEAFERALDEVEKRNDIDGLVVEVTERLDVTIRPWPPFPSGDMP